MEDGKKSRNIILGFLAGRIPLREDLSQSRRNAELGELQGRTSAVVNFLLVVLKFGLAFLSGSIAMLADALNNLGDIAGSLVLIFGFRLSQKPRDRDHPYGHGRLRTIAGLVLSIILVVVGVEAAKSGVMRIIDPQPVTATAWMLAAVCASIVLKGWLAYFSRVLARMTGDAALASEAWNHFYDILSTSLVLLALVCARYELPSVDGWAGILISGFIIYTGIRFALETSGILIGKAPTAEQLNRIHELAHTVDGVQGVHDIQIHEYGNMRLVTLHVELDAANSALQCHTLTERVENLVAEHCNAKVIVHGDPVDISHPEYRRISTAFNEFVAANDDFVDFHDLRIRGSSPALDVEVDMVANADVSSKKFRKKADEVHRFITEHTDGIRSLDIGIECEYASDPEYRKSYPETASQ